VPDDSSDAALALAPHPDTEVRVRSRRRPRTDWRLGGRTVRAWREGMLAVALLSLGAGVLAAALLRAVLPVAAPLAIGLGMLAAVVWAFRRSRPVGLLRFRAVDLLWGIGLALLLRVAQGWIAVAAGGSGALPTSAVEGGAGFPAGTAADAALLVAGVVVVPVLTVLLVRAVMLVSLFTALRRRLGAPAAGIVAVLVCAAVSALVQAVTSAFDVAALAPALLLGLVCGALVMLTGRIWAAVLVHLLYACSLAALAAVGSFLA
jgi:uncharacterized protein